MFCKKISEDDALQGALGNCFAIAAFGTWAGVKGRVAQVKGRGCSSEFAFDSRLKILLKDKQDRSKSSTSYETK